MAREDNAPGHRPPPLRVVRKDEDNLESENNNITGKGSSGGGSLHSVVMPDGSTRTVSDIKEEIKRTKEQMRPMGMHIAKLKALIEASGYDEPVACLSCGWEGKESELDENCTYSGDCWSDDGHTGCPKCKSLSWEYVEA